jgi:hypothetical protein
MISILGAECQALFQPFRPSVPGTFGGSQKKPGNQPCLEIEISRQPADPPSWMGRTHGFAPLSFPRFALIVESAYQREKILNQRLHPISINVNQLILTFKVKRPNSSHPSGLL